MSTNPGTGEPGASTEHQWTLRRRVTALCLLAATVLTFLAAGATTTAMANRGQLDSLLDQIGPMRTAASDLEAALVDQEAAVRGYRPQRINADLEPIPRTSWPRSGRSSGHRRQPGRDTADQGAG